MEVLEIPDKIEDIDPYVHLRDVCEGMEKRLGDLIVQSKELVDRVQQLRGEYEGKSVRARGFSARGNWPTTVSTRQSGKDWSTLRR